LKGEKPRGTDPEACAYLYSASLESPMGHDWTQIYLYTEAQCLRHFAAIEKGNDWGVL